MDIAIRNATADDAPFLAWVMLTASRSHRPFGLWEQFVGGTGQQALSFLEKIAVTNIPHLFHYDVFMIAEKNGKPVAGLSGFDPADRGMMIFGRALPEVYDQIGWTKADIKEALRRSASFFACMADEMPGVWILESVAAVPEIRRQGIMSVLLQEIIARGKAKGFEKAQISVLLSNTPARGAYEKCGFRYVDERRNPDFEAIYGDYGIARLMMRLC